MAKKAKNIEPIKLVRAFLEERGFEVSSYSMSFGDDNHNMVSYARVKLPLTWEYLSVFVEGLQVKIRTGSLKRGWAITVHGTLADPDNSALENLAKIVTHFCGDGFKLMSALTDVKEW